MAVEVVRALEAGENLVVSVDGPLGPRLHVKPGVRFSAA